MGRLPPVFNQHFTGNLGNWDPAVLDGSPRSARALRHASVSFNSLHEKGGTANGKNASRASTK
jgi:hypothetical protein